MPRGPVRDIDEVRGDVIAAAERLIVERGVRALRLRDVLALSGVSNGQLYGAFASLDEAILSVNAKTLGRLEERLQRGAVEDDPADRLVAFARLYLRFALEETPLWRALFEFESQEESALDAQLRGDQARLFEYPGASLAALYPDLGETEVLLRARTLFSAVHGIVSISLESRYSGVNAERLEEELTGLVAAAIRGYGA
ncbi:TetR/AcrR family transcriptional regulator [Jiella mangrovi]|uniref:TetR/AcrR family transcriptional regulator n=1 Tax=Jiella mangrovi TaxID=2821407 RepID=A0ABS4BLR5_9HYPH|nr:TetR/AcrR family transcriptional regulator [Jiella mangrovi]MBP0617657.1 TetR/AcrR family transcriptional regulator [Jiella mangrovi]